MTAVDCDVRLTHVTYARPPKRELHLDVVLRPTAPRPRWVLLPGTASEPPAGVGPRRIAAFYAYELTGRSGRIAAVTAIGDTDAIAVLVPASGGLTLAGVPLSYWGDPPEALELELLTAAELLVDGRPLAELLERTLASDPDADVDAATLAGQMAAVDSLDTRGGPALELTLVEPEREVVSVRR